jgi:hypothetical protein
MAVEILNAMFVDKRRVEVNGAERLYHYHNAVIELIARNILRADYDLIGGTFVTVLQPGGRQVVEILKTEASAK